MAVPNIFGTATAAIPLSQLDTNFATAITLGNTAVYLGNTTTSFGNVTLTNVTISSGNVTVTSPAIFPAGTAALPAITTSGDTNTGIFFPAADTIGFTEGGVEAMRLDSGGNLALGGTTASSVISGTATVAQISNSNLAVLALNHTGAKKFSISSQSTSSLVFYDETASAERARITAAGELVINRTSTVNGAKVMVGAPASGVAYGTEWADSVYMSQMRFDASYYVGVMASAATRELRLEANSGDSNARITFYTGASGTTSERARIDSSGNFFVATTGLGTIGSSSGFEATTFGSIYSAATNDSVFARRSSDGTVITFRRDTTSVGRIDVTTTATSYVTSSDYRLKNSIAPMTGALAKVAALKPVTYKWNSNSSNGEGFIAHELAEVVPQCVTGKKDAVNEDGSINPQGIDTSFLVATLTAAIQEQQALITQLTARITALEGA